MNFRRFIESLESFVYRVPKDKEEQLFDFYAISQVPKTGDVGIDYAIDETRETLYPVLKKNLLNAVFFAICAEIRHSVYIIDSECYEEDPCKEFWRNTEDRIGKEHADLLEKYYSAFHGGGATLWRHGRGDEAGLKADWPALPHKDLTAKTRYSNHDERVMSYNIVKKLGVPRATFVKLAKHLFGNLHWAGAYGGEPWERICNGWLKLNGAESIGDMQVWIDHVYDLQHNSNVVLDKVRTYYKTNGIWWLKRALDFKSRIKSLHEIWDNMSGEARRLVGLATKGSKPAYAVEKGRFDPATKDAWDERGEKEYHVGSLFIRLTPEGKEKLKKDFEQNQFNAALRLHMYNNFTFNPNSVDEQKLLRGIGVDFENFDYLGIRSYLRRKAKQFAQENWRPISKMVSEAKAQHHNLYLITRKVAADIQQKFKVSLAFAEQVVGEWPGRLDDDATKWQL